MSRKLRIKERKARDKMINLIRKILKEHPRDTPKKDGGRTITKRTGNLFKEIKPTIKITDKKLIMEVRMMDYYQWLDAGTSKMDGWFFSEEIMDSKELIDITEELMADSLEERLLDMISDINKK
jgi:hypothetical protein